MTRLSDYALVRLSCVDDDNQGAPLEILWEKELDPQVLTSEAWESIAAQGFDESKLFAAYLNTLKWNCVTSTDPKLFQSPFRAGIRLDAYQLEPLRKALLLPRVNLFIADDVGLGKTIEAGLIARELLLRKKVREIYVSCPPSMLLQWKEELEARFGLTFEILDKDYMKQVRRERGFGVNPWSTHTRFLVSHRLLIDEAYAGPLRDHLGTFRSGSLFILDEAHHAAPSSGQKYAIDSQITRSVRDLAPRFEHRLFLSATPHNGHSNSFSALLEILDPQRFCRGVSVTAKHRDEVIVRRIKEDIREIQGGFPKRRVVQVTIDGLSEDAPELKLSRLLNEYRQTREERLKTESKSKQAASGLLIIGLQQRLLSSIEAFAKTLKVHRATVRRQWEKMQAETSESTPLLRAAEGTPVGDDLVHLHLEQRVVQRLLGRFTAQGFVHHDLSRACFAQATDSIPRVVLLGRLALYGEGAARLHEELIPVTARWTDPKIRKGTLSPYAKDAEAKTMALLDDSLIDGVGIKLTPEVIAQLQHSAPGDIRELLPRLETRGEEYAADAIQKLVSRGAAEAKAMREILETQRKHLSETIKKFDKLDRDQLKFDFAQEDELEQLDANKRYWVKRLEELREELKTEPDRIEDLYKVKATRVEPVGLVYLWPVTG